MITIETKLDFKNYLKLMYVLTYRKPIIIFFTILGFIMFMASILYFLGLELVYDDPPFFALVFGFIVTVIMPLSVYKASKKSFISNGRIQEKIIFEFTEETMRQIGETFNSEMDWTKIYKIVELKNWILIYQNNQSANLVSKESFGDNLTAFRHLVKSKGIKAKLRK